MECRLDGDDEDEMDFEQLSNIKSLDQDPDYHPVLGFTMPSTRSTRQSKSLNFHEDVTAV